MDIMEVNVRQEFLKRLPVHVRKAYEGRDTVLKTLIDAMLSIMHDHMIITSKIIHYMEMEVNAKEDKTMSSLWPSHATGEDSCLQKEGD